MTGSRDAVKAALWDHAAGQRGYFTAAQARTAGYTYQAQRYHAQRGHWILVDRGVYRFREWEALPGREDDHLVRWALWSKGRATVSHTTALSVHDLGVANPSAIHLTVPRGFRQKEAGVVLHHADLANDEREEHQGFHVTTPVRAIAECAAAGVDQDIVDSAVEEALNRGLTTRRRLLAAARRLGGRAELGVKRALREPA